MSDVLIEDAAADDIPHLTRIRMEACRSTLSICFEPQPYVISREERAIRNNAGFKDEYFAISSSSNQIIAKKAVQGGKIVGFAVFIIHQADWKDKEEEEKRAKDEKVKTDKEKEKESWQNEGLDLEWIKWFRQSTTAIKEGVLAGQSYVYLKWLAVDPAAQGKGIGKKLLAECTKCAERLGVPCYLEATEAGEPVYRKAEFVTVQILPCTSSRSPEVVHNLACMIKKA